MPTMDLQSEQFRDLLAEALRAGPGSPPWHQAVEALRPATGLEKAPGDSPAGKNIADAADYALLLRAREDLASGRNYRTVRAGPGFTRKLMDQIETEGPGLRLSLTGVIAGAAMVVVGLTIVLGVYFLSAKGGKSPTTDQLANTYFVTTSRADDLSAGQPKDFAYAGQLPLTFAAGAAIDPAAKLSPPGVGGGLHLLTPLPANKTFAVESVFAVADPSAPLTAQLFITDNPAFAEDTSLTPHELAAIIDRGRVRVVLPDAKARTDVALDTKSAQTTLRIRCNADSAVIEQNGKVVWAGQHHLSPDQPRYVGIRYLARPGDKTDAIRIKSMKLLEP